MIDLRPHFRHLHWRPMPHSFGIPVASDFADTPPNHKFALYRDKCGLWTMGEVEILFLAAARFRGDWVDIGAHTGWTTAHIARVGNTTVAVDPMLAVQEFRERFEVNTLAVSSAPCLALGMTSADWLRQLPPNRAFRGACVDGAHDAPIPLEDAKGCYSRMSGSGVIVLHDCVGQPVQDAVCWLAEMGWAIKVYPTVHGVAACYFGEDFPEVPDALPEMKITAPFVKPRLGAIAKWSVL